MDYRMWMKMLGDLLRRLRERRQAPRKSFSQCGEDLIISFVCRAIGLSEISYLDIGSHHPVLGNNTFLFYGRGRGVCVDPNPRLAGLYRRMRPHDTYLMAGVSGGGEDAADYHIMSAETLNTFSREDAERIEGEGIYRVEDIRRVPLLDINAILQDRFAAPPHVLSLDTEGTEYSILSSLDFSRFSPHVICVETLRYSDRIADETKDVRCSQLGERMGYFVYADTYVNTILVKRDVWEGRKG